MVTETIKTTMKEFAEAVRDAVEASLGEEYQVQINDVVRNNDMHLTGLVIYNGISNMAPNIYLENYFSHYQEGMTMDEISQDIIRTYEKYRVSENFDTTIFFDFNRVKDRICYKLVNAKRNQERLADTPCMEFYDLVLVPYILIAMDENGIQSCQVKDYMLGVWDVSKETLFDLAKQNTQRLFCSRVESLKNVIMGIMKPEMSDEEADEFYEMSEDVEEAVPMYVCTNSSKMYGAGTIFYDGLLKDFADRIGSDFYILPSSIHETLFIPASAGLDVELLKEMVRDVNHTEVLPNEILSDNVYYYDRNSDHVEIR